MTKSYKFNLPDILNHHFIGFEEAGMSCIGHHHPLVAVIGVARLGIVSNSQALANSFPKISGRPDLQGF